MKVLQEGVWLEIECSQCKTRFQCEPSDAKASPKPDADGDHVGCYDNYRVECPKCGNGHPIPESKINQKIRDIVHEKWKEARSRR